MNRRNRALNVGWSVIRGINGAREILWAKDDARKLRKSNFRNLYLISDQVPGCIYYKYKYKYIL